MGKKKRVGAYVGSAALGAGVGALANSVGSIARSAETTMKPVADFDASKPISLLNQPMINVSTNHAMQALHQIPHDALTGTAVGLGVGLAAAGIHHLVSRNQMRNLGK